MADSAEGVCGAAALNVWQMKSTRAQNGMPVKKSGFVNCEDIRLCLLISMRTSVIVFCVFMRTDADGARDWTDHDAYAGTDTERSNFSLGFRVALWLSPGFGFGGIAVTFRITWLKYSLSFLLRVVQVFVSKTGLNIGSSRKLREG